jgi:hypothetical protein
MLSVQSIYHANSVLRKSRLTLHISLMHTKGCWSTTQQLYGTLHGLAMNHEQQTPTTTGQNGEQNKCRWDRRCPETSVRNYYCSLQNSPEQRREIPISAGDQPPGPICIRHLDKFFCATRVVQMVALFLTRQAEVDLDVSETDVNRNPPP